MGKNKGSKQSRQIESAGNGKPQSRPPAPEASGGRASCVRVTKVRLAVLGALLLLPWAIVAWRSMTAAWSEHVWTGNSSTTRLGDQVIGPPGPWGRLEIIRISTEPPEDFLTKHMQRDSSQWTFQGFSREKVSNLFRSAGLSEADEAELFGSASIDVSGSTWTFHPSEKLVLGLSPQARATIYLTLAREFDPSQRPLNLAQNDPFRWHSNDLDEWFDNSGVTNESMQLIRRMLYNRGRTVMFSDPSIVLSRLPGPAERFRLLKTLSRQSTLLVKLQISPDTDIGALEDYWGRGPRGKDIRPLLDSLKQVHRGVSIDIVHLLPRFARKRLYNYPSLAKNDNAESYDCHWSSMNFWNDPPDDRFGVDSEYVQQVLDRDYYRVQGDHVFGDILFFMIGRDQAIHSAVYIAADIVFTKNGASSSSPWILMQLPRLQSFYETYADLKIWAYRRKDTDRSTSTKPG